MHFSRRTNGVFFTATETQALGLFEIVEGLCAQTDKPLARPELAPILAHFANVCSEQKAAAAKRARLEALRAEVSALEEELGR